MTKRHVYLKGTLIDPLYTDTPDAPGLYRYAVPTSSARRRLPSWYTAGRLRAE